MTENLAGRGEGLAGLRKIAELARQRGFDAERYGKAITATNFHEIARLLEALEAAAPPGTAPPELLCINCGHSYAQHTKGINHPQKYCRHCPCLEWTALETPDHKPAWEEMNRVRDRAEKVLGAEYLGWNWVHALVDKLEKIEACTCTDEIRHVHCPVHGDSFLPQPITALATPSPQAPAEQRYENALRDVLGLAEAAWNNGMGFGEAKTIAQICTGALSTPSAYIAAPSKLPQSFDARDWAKEFTEICATKGIAIDQDWMETWFANAIMAGYDHARAATQEHIPERGMEEKMSNWDFKRREGLYLKFSEPMAEPHTPVIIERVNGDCWVSTFLIARDEAHELINQLCEFLRVGSPRKVGEDGGCLCFDIGCDLRGYCLNPQCDEWKQANAIARRFHEAYERLAPDFGYETRRDSAVHWDHLPEKNRKLMLATCATLLRTSGVLRPSSVPVGEQK